MGRTLSEIAEAINQRTLPGVCGWVEAYGTDDEPRECSLCGSEGPSLYFAQDKWDGVALCLSCLRIIREEIHP